MYGLINQSIKELIVSKYGLAEWDAICALASSPSDDFVLEQHYPEAWTFRLLDAAAAWSRSSTENVLEDFGKYFAYCSVHSGRISLKKLFGHNFATSLMNLPNLQAPVGVRAMDGRDPYYKVVEISEGIYWIEFHSSGRVESALIQGIVEGIAICFAKKVHIEILPGAKEITTFQIEVLS